MIINPLFEKNPTRVKNPKSLPKPPPSGKTKNQNPRKPSSHQKTRYPSNQPTTQPPNNPSQTKQTTRGEREGDLQDVKLKQHTATERVRFIVQRKGRKNLDTENSGGCARSPGDRSRCAARINEMKKKSWQLRSKHEHF